MKLGARIRLRLDALGWKQTELARRTGIAQTTINSLVNGNARSTPHLVKIAQALQTSPAYLTGETDDPSSVLPDAPQFTADELLVVDCLRQISPKDRAALIQLARSLAGASTENGVPIPTFQAPRQSYGLMPAQEVTVHLTHEKPVPDVKPKRRKIA